MSDLVHVFVLAGGLSVERDVSLRSGRRVCDALREVGVSAEIVDADVNLLPRLSAEPPTALFVALHGGQGENGAIQGVLDVVGVPYAGSSASACRVAFDKPTAKAVVRSAGIATPEWLALPHPTFRELGASAVLDRVVARLGLPIVVKPTAGGSALGVTVVRDAHELPAALVHCFGYGHTALLEKFVAGTELAITVLDTERGPQALPAVEIAVHEGGEYDYAARYTAGSTTFYAPARVADEVAAATAAAAVRAHEALGLADLSRMDCIVDDAGVVHFLEVNTSPGLTETSLVPLALGAADLELGVVVRDLLQQAVNRTRR